MLKRESCHAVPRTVIVLPEAEDDIESAYDWYEKQAPGLGRDFVLAIRAANLAIAEHPELYSLRFHGVRRYLLKRFPYAMYYRYNDHSVRILKVFHSGAMKYL